MSYGSDWGAGGRRLSRRNHLTGLDRFREAWDLRSRQDGSPKNVRSDQGHVNLDGSATCFRSAIFTPADPEFLDSIELGVRDLVLFLVDTLGCITYSSCEGHAPLDTLLLRERHVGILPRNEREHVRLLRFLRRAAIAVRATQDHKAIRLDISEDFITTEGPDTPCIEIVFKATTQDWLTYRGALEPTYREFLNLLLIAASKFGIS